MAKYPYTQSIAKLKNFLEHIQSAGVPSKVTQKYLEQCGYTSKNDRSIISVLKAIGFLDQSGTPTSVWQQYRDKSKASGVLAAAVRSAYPDLFSTYPEAQKRDEEALRNYFGANTDVGEKALGLTVSTFRALCDLADFDAISETGASKALAKAPVAIPESDVILATSSTTKSGLTVNINIELTIPATDDEKVYDKFFAAMKKHLL